MAASDIKAEEGGLTRTLKDLFAGAAGGIAQVLLGQSVHEDCHGVCDLVLSRAADTFPMIATSTLCLYVVD